MSLLASTQDNIDTLKLGPLHGSYLALPESLRSWPRKVRFLESKRHIGDEQDFLSFERIMKNSSRILKELVVRMMRSEPHIEQFNERAQDSETSDGLVSKMLRGQVNSEVEAVTKIDLSTLVLQDVRSYYADRTFTRSVDFSRLSSLDLFTCPGVAKLLAVLTVQFCAHGNSVKGLTLCIAYGDEPEPTSFDCDILHNFIHCLAHLDYLTLDIWSITKPFELKWIESHAKTLERLYICISSTTGSIDHTYGYDILPLEDLQHLCENFQRLKQVAICLPKIDLLFEKPDNEKMATYKSYLTALACLPNLKILRIFTWPIAPLFCFTTVGKRDRINPQVFDSFMKDFANIAILPLMGTLNPGSRSKLKIVCFGDRHIWALEASDGEHFRANSRCYAVDHREDGSVMKPLTAKTAQDHVPDASAWHVPYGERVEEE